MTSTLSEKRERRLKREASDQARKRSARRLAILSFVLSISIYKGLYAFSLAANIEVIPLKWIITILVLVLGGLANVWHKKFNMSIQHSAGAVVFGSMLSLSLILAIAVVSANSEQ
ncbi:MAG: hypothetical protein AAGJ81_04420 [Verrucomicrobiota bacterium]